MPPSRAKLHNKTGKLKTIKPVTSEPQSGTSSAAASRDSEADRQFEVELCWCIQQLETSLNSGKLNQKQTQDTEKAIKILKSGNQPVIKKRQLMRTTFGDYRAKMAEEEKKMSLAARQIKFADQAPSKKSHFVKKAALLTSGKDFRFNFPVEKIEQLNISEDVAPVEDNKPKLQSHQETAFHFLPTGNTFKFNFNIETEES